MTHKLFTAIKNVIEDNGEQLPKEKILKVIKLSFASSFESIPESILFAISPAIIPIVAAGIVVVAFGIAALNVIGALIDGIQGKIDHDKNRTTLAEEQMVSSVFYLLGSFIATLAIPITAVICSAAFFSRLALTLVKPFSPPPTLKEVIIEKLDSIVPAF